VGFHLHLHGHVLGAHRCGVTAYCDLLLDNPRCFVFMRDHHCHRFASVMGSLFAALYPEDRGLPVAPWSYAPARITRASLSKISPISRSLTISGGVTASVSPTERMVRLSSWKARTMAS